MVGQRVQALGPHVLVHVPVAQSGVVVAAAAEPAVVEHEPLDAGLGGRVRQGTQPGQVVPEVDGLPGVEGDRAGAARVVRPCAQRPVEAGGQRVKAVAVRGVQPGGGVRRAGAQAHLPGQQRLAAGEQRGAFGGALGQRTMVAAPGGVHGPDLAATETEAGFSCGVQQGGVEPGTAATAVAQVGAEGERVALRAAFAQVTSGQVEQFGGAGGHGEGEEQAVHGVRGQPAVTGVGERGAQPQQSGVGQLRLDAQREAGLRICSLDGQAPGGVFQAVHGERGGEVCAVAVAGQARGAGPAGRRLGEQGEWHRVVRGAGGVLCRSAAASAARVSASRAPRSSPQCSTRGSAVPVQSRTRLTPPALRWATDARGGAASSAVGHRVSLLGNAHQATAWRRTTPASTRGSRPPPTCRRGRGPERPRRPSRLHDGDAIGAGYPLSAATTVPLTGRLAPTGTGLDPA